MGTSEIGYNPTLIGGNKAESRIKELRPLNLGLIPGGLLSSYSVVKFTPDVYRNSQGGLEKTNILARPIFL